jgi:phage FluMu protein gp41
MSFGKAVKRTQIPEYTEYCAAMLVYKKDCSAHQMLMRKLKHLKDSTNVLERAQFYDERAKFSQACKNFHNARKNYETAVAMAEIKAKGVDLSLVEIAKIMNITIPLSMAQIIEAEKKERVLASVTQEQWDMLEEAQKIRRNRGSLKDSFLADKNSGHSVLKEDPTLNDFEDLPEPALAPAIAEPVDADTSIEFDPEFDKL